MSRTYPNADAVSAAIAALLPADARQLSTIEQEDGTYVVTGTDAALAKLEAGPSKERLVAYAADKRWQVETRTVTIGGVPFVLDDRTQMKILGARVAADANPAWTTVWDGPDGNSYPVNATQMIAISDAAQVHINTAFVLYGTLKAAIDAGTVTTFAEIDAAAWPA